jgi:hypothetical protein
VRVVAAATIVHDYIGIGLSHTGEEVLRWCALVYAALPLAFLVGVLRTHIRRAILARLLADLGRGTTYEDAALEEAAAAARPSSSPARGTKAPCLRGFRVWAVTGSNRRPPACKAGALPAELTARAR